MVQIILKAGFNIGWGNAHQFFPLGGEGNIPLFTTFGVDAAKSVLPLAGTFNHLSIYSPAGTHPNYSVTLYVNGVASALSCSLASSDTFSSDLTNSVAVSAGDDVYFDINVNPIGVGAGYTLALSVEFTGSQQFYPVIPAWGPQTVNTYNTAGALGNGVQQTISAPNQLSNTHSICTTAGTLTGMRMKTYSGAPGTDSWVGYITKNQVLQDGTAGTVNTACTLTGANTQANNTFTLPIAVGDHLDFALLRTGTTSPSSLANVAMSVLFTPTDPTLFMSCGGSNDANDQTVVGWKWVRTDQLTASENISQCPIGVRGFTLSGLYVEFGGGAGNPGTGKSVVYVIRKNGVNTAATVTIADLNHTANITGLSIPFADGDLIDLQQTPINNPASGNGLWWGLVLVQANPPPGMYIISGTLNDNGIAIPAPTFRTGLVP